MKDLKNKQQKQVVTILGSLIIGVLLGLFIYFVIPEQAQLVKENTLGLLMP
ncbi:MAG: hypothetical protein MK212_10475 [Saprospiraceae bacterium]|nr:hypothetical protein [Saprospiraceae bacterium]